LEKVKNKLQSMKKGVSGEEPSVTGVAKSIYEAEGWYGFVDGVPISSLGSATEKFIYFYAYSFVRSLYERAAGGPPGTLTDLLVGYLCEFMHLPISMPLDTIGVKIQTNKDPNMGVSTIINNTLKETGISGMYKGWQAYYALSFKPSIQYAVFEQFKAFFLGGRTELSALEAFCGGALGRAVATITTFPYTRAKILKQSRKRSMRADSLSSELVFDDEEEQNKVKAIPKHRRHRQVSMTTTEVIQDVANNEGIFALYRGMGPELFRGVISAALMMMVKEKIYHFVKTLIYNAFGMRARK